MAGPRLAPLWEVATPAGTGAHTQAEPLRDGEAGGEGLEITRIQISRLHTRMTAGPGNTSPASEFTVNK